MQAHGTGPLPGMSQPAPLPQLPAAGLLADKETPHGPKSSSWEWCSPPRQGQDHKRAQTFHLPWMRAWQLR